MPRKAIDYSKSLLYTIRTLDSLYVGSTTNFANRKNQHKNTIYNENRNIYNSKLYKTIRENGGEWIMAPYKEYPCENNTQLLIEEERVRCELNADLNSNVCYTGLNTENKNEYHKEYDKKWRENNKDKVAKKNKKWREKNAEKWRENNKEYYKEYREKAKEKITCPCGCIISRNSLSRHKKSKKHLEWVATKS